MLPTCAGCGCGRRRRGPRRLRDEVPGRVGRRPIGRWWHAARAQQARRRGAPAIQDTRDAEQRVRLCCDCHLEMVCFCKTRSHGLQPLPPRIQLGCSLRVRSCRCEQPRDGPAHLLPEQLPSSERLGVHGLGRRQRHDVRGRGARPSRRGEGQRPARGWSVAQRHITTRDIRPAYQ